MERRYKKIKVVGKGSYGTAVLCLDQHTSKKVVIKRVDIRKLSEPKRAAALREAELLRSFQHPAIVRHLSSFTSNGFLHIVCEFAEHGDLAHFIANRKGRLFSERTVLTLLAQMALALRLIHRAKVLHRDLKVQNIFLNSRNEIKIGDFGIARQLAHTMEKACTLVGTPFYLSPELCKQKPYSYKSDIWSLGCVVYELCCQKPAFEAVRLRDIVMRITTGKFDPLPTTYSRSLRRLVRLMLAQDPTCRPDANAILRLPMMQPYLKWYLRRHPSLRHTCRDLLPQQPRQHPRPQLPNPRSPPLAAEARAAQAPTTAALGDAGVRVGPRRVQSASPPSAPAGACNGRARASQGPTRVPAPTRVPTSPVVSPPRRYQVHHNRCSEVGRAAKPTQDSGRSAGARQVSPAAHTPPNPLPTPPAVASSSEPVIGTPTTPPPVSKPSKHSSVARAGTRLHDTPPKARAVTPELPPPPVSRITHTKGAAHAPPPNAANPSEDGTPVHRQPCTPGGDPHAVTQPSPTDEEAAAGAAPDASGVPTESTDGKLPVPNRCAVPNWARPVSDSVDVAMETAPATQAQNDHVREYGYGSAVSRTANTQTSSEHLDEASTAHAQLLAQLGSAGLLALYRRLAVLFANSWAKEYPKSPATHRGLPRIGPGVTTRRREIIMAALGGAGSSANTAGSLCRILQLLKQDGIMNAEERG